MIRALLSVFGYRIEYHCKWGVFTHRYDGFDYFSGRPIHEDMGVAPPWAERRIVKIR